MIKKSPKPDHLPWASPYIMVSDVGAATEFYNNAFGFEPSEQIPDEDGNICHAEMRFKDAVFMFGLEGAYGSTAKTPKNNGVEPATGMYVYCDDVDQLFQQAKKAGATVVAEPEDTFWGDRMCKLTDSDGHSWAFATNIKPCKGT